MVYVVCQGQPDGTVCSYTSDGSQGANSGLIQGECHPQSAAISSGTEALGGGSRGQMCLDPAHLPTKTVDPLDSDDGLSNTAVVIIAVFGGWSVGTAAVA